MIHCLRKTDLAAFAAGLRFKPVLIAQALMLLVFNVAAQIQVNSGGTTPTYHVNQDLNMVGYSISNVEFFGDPLQLGGFEGADVLGLSSGLVLSTHDVRYPDDAFDIPDNYPAPFAGPYAFGSAPVSVQSTVDAWLEIVDGVTPGNNMNDDVYDFVSLSFDMVAMGDSLLFDLVFASDEYQYLSIPNLDSTNRNDLFALFISGPGLVGTYPSPAGFPAAANTATVPLTNLPISPNTVDPVLDPFLGLFPEEFASITGYSEPMELAVEVECGETYHVQLVLADQVDHTGGSYVFLRCDGHNDEAVLMEWNVLGFAQETNVLFEGCGIGELTFTRPEASPESEALTVSVVYSGSAEMGVDLTALPTTLEFPPGVNEVVWTGVEAFEDLLNEGVESLTIELYNPDACDGNGGINTYTIQLADGPDPIEVEFDQVRVCAGGGAVVEPGISGGYGNYTLEWCDGTVLDLLVIDNIENFLGCELMVGDTCGFPSSSWPIPIEVVQLPTLDVGADTIVCTDSFQLQGEIMNLPSPQCSSAFGSQSYCYGNSAYEVFTYCPDFPGDGTYMNLTFLQGSVDVNDEMWVYDGDEVTDVPLAGPINGNLAGMLFEAQNSGGCLTILIDSNSGNSCQSGTQTPWMYSVGCNATSGYELLWSPSENLSDPSILDPELQVESGASLQLTMALIDAPYCSQTASVTVVPSFEMSATGVNPTCFDPDGVIHLEMNPIGGGGPWTIVLYEGGNLVEELTTPLDVLDLTGLAAGSYEVSITNVHCTHSESLVLVAQPEATISLPADTVICVDGTAYLAAVSSMPELDLDWTWSNGVLDSIQFVSPTQTTVYTCYASLVPGCNTDEHEVTVVVADSLAFDFLETLDLCLGDSVFVEAANFQGGLGPYTWSWTSSAFAVDYDPSVSAQYLSPSLPTTYCLEVSDACETPDFESCVDIFVPDDVDPAFESNVVSGCFPLEVVFEGLAADPSVIASATWDFGDGLSSTDVDSTSHSYNDIGWYGVSYSIVTVHGCTFSYALDSLIRVNPWPIAEFAPDPWEQKLPGSRVEFTNYSLGAVSYEWDFAGFESSTEFEPEFYFPEQAGDYPVQLVATNEWGCADSVAYYIWLIDDFALYVPNAFTPDNDGRNDAWEIIGQDVDPDHYHLMVWNRHGEVVFESRSLDDVWIGDVKGGAHYAQSETFVYAIEARSLSTAIKHKVQGHVTVVR